MKYFYFSIQHSEAAVQMCSVKKVFLEISQNSQENTCTRVSFLSPEACNFIQKSLWHRRFPVNFVEFPITHFLTEHLWWLLLNIHCVCFYLINKKIVLTEKRYRVKFSSIKKHLLLIKQKQKKSKIPKRI